MLSPAVQYDWLKIFDNEYLRMVTGAWNFPSKTNSIKKLDLFKALVANTHYSSR